MFSDLITQKGVRTMALVFGVPRVTVYGWRRRNHIPRSRWDRLMELCPELKFKHLLEMERAARGRFDQAA